MFDKRSLAHASRTLNDKILPRLGEFLELTLKFGPRAEVLPGDNASIFKRVHARNYTKNALRKSRQEIAHLCAAQISPMLLALTTRKRHRQQRPLPAQTEFTAEDSRHYAILAQTVTFAAKNQIVKGVSPRDFPRDFLTMQPLQSPKRGCRGVRRPWRRTWPPQACRIRRRTPLWHPPQTPREHSSLPWRSR